MEVTRSQNPLFVTPIPLSCTAFRVGNSSSLISHRHRLIDRTDKNVAGVSMKEQSGTGRWMDVASEILGGVTGLGGKASKRQAEKGNPDIGNVNGDDVGVRVGKGVREFIEFSTMSGVRFDEDLTAVDAVIKGMRKVDACGSHYDIEVDVHGTGLEAGHARPGQFIQMERKGRGFFGRYGQRAFLTIANAPGRKKSFHFLVSKNADPAGFAKLKVGEQVRLSPVIGEGIDFGDVIKSPTLLLFVDCPQGLAAVKSLLEWTKFRAASGQGLNRTTRVKLYYCTNGPRNVAYRSIFSQWMAFGVDVLPIYANTLSDHFGAVDVMREMGHLGNTMAFASVAAKETVDHLYKILSFGGIQRTAIQSFTQDRVSNEIVAFDFDANWMPPTTVNNPKRYRGVPDSFYEYQEMRDLEEEIWREWVKIRDIFRDEAVRKMNTTPRWDPFDPDLPSNKEQAWSSWFMHNKEEWKEELREDDVWGGYWQTWTAKRNSWTHGSNSSHGSSWKHSEQASKKSSWWTDTQASDGDAHWNAAGQRWYEEKSQEYWDWVGRGTRGYGSSGASSTGDTNRSYDDAYGGSSSWGNANNQGTHYEPGGYKYGWDPSGGSYQDTSSSGWKDRKQEADTGSGTGWSGWNRSSKQKSQGSNYYSSNNYTSKTSIEIDFYEILGVSNNADKTEIKRAYRRAAMKWHPDRNPNSEEALAKMKEVVVAYTILKDPSKRRDYDVYGVAK